MSKKATYCRHTFNLYCESQGGKGSLRLWKDARSVDRRNTTCTWLGEISRSPEQPRPCHCTWDAQTLDVQMDHATLGVLVLYTRGVLANWVDLIISDLSLDSLTDARIRDLERELGAPVGALEIARATHERGHAEIPGSTSFTIIRLCNVGATH